MRYITPEILVKRRAGNNPLPEWYAAILCFHGPDNSQKLVQEFDVRPLGYSVFTGIDDSDVYETVIDSKRIGILAKCGVGGGAGPRASRLVEELDYLGAEYLIGYGAAGGIDPGLPKGQQIVAGSGLTTDGTSRIYCPDREEIPADPELLNLLSDIAEHSSYDIQQVAAATVDALYRETESLLSEWRDKGAQVINMETTPFYAASLVCGIRSVWLGFISDRLINREWDDWYTYQDSVPSESVRICRELAESLVTRFS